VHRLTLGWLNCPDVAPQDMIGVAADAGFASVGLRITGRKPGDAFERIVDNGPLIAAMRQRALDRGVAIHNLSIYHLYPEIGAADLEQVLDAAADLGAPAMLASGYDPDHARYCERMRWFADAAAARDIRLFLEFVPFSAVKTLPAALAIVRAVDKPNFGMIVDPLHLARSGGTPDDVRSVPPDRLFFVQLCDAPRAHPPGVDLPTEARRMRLDPGEGALPLHELLDAVGADIDIECEFPTQANLALPPVERARGIHAAATRYLERHALRVEQQAGG